MMATQVVFSDSKKYPGAIVLVGLPGIGLVGKIVVDYLLKQFSPKKIGEIYSDSFPPSVYTKKGVVDLIKDEIYVMTFKGQTFFFLAGPIQPSLELKSGSSQEHYDFSRTIVSELKKKGVSEVIALAGINIGEKRMKAHPSVIVAATSKKLLENWKKLGAVPSSTEGLISGAAGLLVGCALAEGLEGSCLMGETNIRLVYGDPGAAKVLLELLGKKFGFQLDMNRIEKEAKEIEEAFKQLSQQLESAKEEEPENGLTYVR
ncbi:MAG: PAC2 family protein [Candidatus Diapherotrites archaeon]|nr:PAC2 family protein [Candidatus Diapherotrites archaeon]